MDKLSTSQYAADFISIKTTIESTCETCGTNTTLKHMYNKDHSKIGQDLCLRCY